MMLVHDGANECQKTCQDLYPDVEVLNIREASEETGNHLEIIADSETDMHSEECHAWYHGAGAHSCPSLHLQSQCTNSEKKDPKFTLIV